MERYSNKRAMYRHGGRFAKAPSLEDLGFPVAKGEMQCEKCGYRCYPLVTTWTCSQCGHEHAPPNSVLDHEHRNMHP